MDFILRSTKKVIEEPEISWGRKALVDLDYADANALPNSKEQNVFLEIFIVHGARISLNVNVKKAKLLRLGISEGEEVMLGKEKVNQVDSFTYIGSIISKDSGCNKDIKSKILKTEGVYSQLKKAWKNTKISLQTNIRILEATVIIVVK